MMSQPASLFVIVFTAINVLACLWLLWWTAQTRSAPASHSTAAEQESNAAGSGVEKTGHVWDGDLEEYNNPLPRWWLGLFIVTVLFGAGYLAVYPGMGNFAGTSRWSSVGEYEGLIEQQRTRFEQRLAGLQDKTLPELASDAAAMSTARNLFGANCSTCHGSDARGAKGFPNLTDADWLWGGDATTVYQTIAGGRHGVMPALGDVLGPTGINEVASYVVSLSGRAAPADWIAAGKDRFEMLCAACHGADAKGNSMLGAPNLSDKTWLHGGDFASISTTITKGRDNQMPAHSELLGDFKVRLLAAYVLSLSANPSGQFGEAVPMAANDNATPAGSLPVAVTRESAAHVSANARAH